MRLWCCLALFALALTGLARAQTPIEIADGRAARDMPDLSAWASRPVMQQAIASARAYWRRQASDYEEDVRVLGMAEGAFTKAGAKQQAVLYLMSLWPRCCPKMGLAIVENGQLVHNVAFEGVAQEVMTVPDLDADGRDELAFVGEFGMGGQVSQSLTLAAFGTDGLAERGATALFDSDCAAGPNGAGSSATRVLARPGPVFMVEHYTMGCEAEDWQATGEAEPLELVPSETTQYTNLPVGRRR